MAKKKADAAQPSGTCPNCSGPLFPAPVPSDEQRTRAADKENREPFPPHFDTMSAADRAEHGALATCMMCGYKTRIPIADASGEGASAD